MKNQSEIEAGLERSLRKQVVAPRLDGRFDAAVWSRIECEEQPATKSRPAAAAARQSARWLFTINAIGAAVTLLLVVYFGVQAFSDVEVNMASVAIPVPEVSASAMAQLGRFAGWIIAAGAIGFGLMFTSLGRRVRSELHQFL